MLIFSIVTVLKMEFYQLFYQKKKLKNLSEYSKRKEEISIDLNEEKIIFGNSEIKFDIDPFKKKMFIRRA